MAARAQQVAAGKPRRPIVVKIAPDIAEADMPAITERLMAHEVDAHRRLEHDAGAPGRQPHHDREGGRRALRPAAVSPLDRDAGARPSGDRRQGAAGRHRRHRQSGDRALAKIEAGASLLQLYTGLIYEGAGLIGRIKRHLDETCHARGVANISALTGTRAAEWASRPLDA